jgi:sporulation protein YlmC with PRC-barrel domain
MLKVKGIPVLASIALMGLFGFAGPVASAEDDNCAGDDIALVKAIVDKADITLVEAIQMAEHQTNGRAIHATLGCATDLSDKKLGPENYQVCCLAKDKIIDVCVDSRSGSILAIQESDNLPTNVRLASSREFASTKPVEKSEDPSFRVLKASDFIGMPVVNNSGETLGEIQDLAIDTDHERVAYAVLSFGGFLGMGDKWFAIPATALTLPADHDHFVLAMEKDRLSNAPGFEKNRWPQMGDSTWESGIHKFYGKQPYWMNVGEGSTPRNVNRIQKASDIMGRAVHNDQRENLGTIKDLVIDPDQYRIAYTVLSFGGFLGLGDKLFAMPASVLQLPSNENFAVLTVDKNRLKDASGFDKNQWPNLADPTVASGIYSYYGQRPYWTE